MNPDTSNTGQKSLQAFVQANTPTLDTLGDCVTVLGLDGNIEYVSPAWLKSAGIPADAMIGHRALSLFAPNSLANAPSIMNTILSGNNWQGKSESRILGREFGGYASVSPIYNGNKEIIGIISIIVDSQEYMNLEKWLANEGKELEAVSKGVAMDAEGNVTYFSEVGIKITGFAAAQIVGQPIYRTLAEDFHEEFRRVFAEVLDKNDRLIDLRIKCADGRVVTAPVLMTPVIDHAGKVKGVTGRLRTESNIMQLPVTKSLSSSAKSDSVPLGQRLDSVEQGFHKLQMDFIQPLGVNHIPGKSLPVRHSLEIHCLGNFAVGSPTGKIQNWHDRKAKLLFELLVSRRPAAVSKDILIETLWPEHSDRGSARNLRSVVYSLRKTLQVLFADNSLLIVMFTQGSYVINPQIEVSVDAEEFEQHWTTGKHLAAEGDMKAAVQEFIRAEKLYLGDYLEDELYEEWTVPVREALRDTYLLMLDKVANIYQSNGDFENCIAYCHKILSKDPTREDIYQRLMCCYGRLGSKSQAMHWYRRCVEVMRSQMNTEVSPETTQLVEKLNAGNKI
jgi:PAS domain S-box-containing protein